MYSYIKGIIVDMAKDYIVVDNQGIGYLIFVSNPYQFTRGKETLVYVYQQVKEDGILLFGFLTKEEKDLYNLNDMMYYELYENGGLAFHLKFMYPQTITNRRV